MKTNHDDKTIFQNPARRHQNIYTDSPHRYITCYNPTKMLTTADKSITNALNETYKMKENVTEESVIDYFEQILDNFDEKESEQNPAKSESITSNLNEKANTGKLSINSKNQVDQISVSGSVNKKQKNHINLDRLFKTNLSDNPVKDLVVLNTKNLKNIPNLIKNKYEGLANKVKLVKKR